MKFLIFIKKDQEDFEEHSNAVYDLLNALHKAGMLTLMPDAYTGKDGFYLEVGTNTVSGVNLLNHMHNRKFLSIQSHNDNTIDLFSYVEREDPNCTAVPVEQLTGRPLGMGSEEWAAIFDELCSTKRYPGGGMYVE